MSDKDIKMLVQAILDYGQWVKSLEEHGRSRHTIRYSQILIDFLMFVISNDIGWKDMFTFDTLQGFRKYSDYKGASRALKGLSEYLFSQGRIDQVIQFPKPHNAPLPDIYEEYLLYHEHSGEVSSNHLRQARRLLLSLHEYLQKHNIELTALKIGHLDAFMASFKVAHSTGRLYRSHFRNFLRYLYHERRIIKKDLASLFVGPVLYAQDKPPKFLRPQEVKKLFATLKLSTPTDIRTYAMVHLVYSLGLRPVEVTRITLDDISFQKAEITLRERKMSNPITLPIPEKTIKAVAAYLSKIRPKSLSRHLFLTFHLPFRPVSSATVIHHIAKAMKQAGINASSYWLRHTYAQNLLQTGQSIYEIKEMLGQQKIQSTHKYLHIHTELMRKVLFNEELS
jgi:integrase/recombinase XerD